tara:strand:- start:1384 stop:2676 length:1293 start_codon:yes stop_codon:yes gene_type:complete
MYYIRDVKGFDVRKRNFLKYVERAWLKCEIHRMRQEALVEHSLKNKSLVCLLTEQGANADNVVSDLNAAADEAAAGIDDMLSKIPAKMTAARDALGKAKAEIAKNRLKTGFSLSRLMGDPVKKLSKMFGNIQILQSSIAQAFQTLGGALGDLGAKVADDEEAKAKEIGELIDEFEASDEEGMPSRSEFEKAIGAQMKAPAGLFGGLGQGFSNMMGSLGLGGGRDLGFGMEQSDFIEDVMKLTPTELDEFLTGSAQALDDAATPSDDDPVQQLDNVISDAGLDDEIAAAEEGAPEGEGEPAAGEEGDVDTGEPVEGEEEAEEAEEDSGFKVSAPDFAEFIKGQAGLVQKAVGSGKPARKARKKFRAELDGLAGGGVFQENKFHLFDMEDAMLTEDALHNSPPSVSLHTLEPPPYEEDDLIHHRWLKMAGLL